MKFQFENSFSCISIVEQTSGRLPLHVALETGNKKLIQAFVANGASLVARDWEGNTAYHYAATTSQDIIQVNNPLKTETARI
jgi:ankyrin repeat protein